MIHDRSPACPNVLSVDLRAYQGELTVNLALALTGNTLRMLSSSLSPYALTSSFTSYAQMSSLAAYAPTSSLDLYALTLSLDAYVLKSTLTNFAPQLHRVFPARADGVDSERRHQRFTSSVWGCRSPGWAGAAVQSDAGYLPSDRSGGWDLAV